MTDLEWELDDEDDHVAGRYWQTARRSVEPFSLAAHVGYRPQTGWDYYIEIIADGANHLSFYAEGDAASEDAAKSVCETLADLGLRTVTEWRRGR